MLGRRFFLISLFAGERKNVCEEDTDSCGAELVAGDSVTSVSSSHAAYLGEGSGRSDGYWLCG